MAEKTATAITQPSGKNQTPPNPYQESIGRDAVAHPSMQETPLSDYFQVLKRRKGIIISIFFIIVCTVSTVSFYLTPQYEATAQILLGGQPTPMNPLGDSYEQMAQRIHYFKTQVNLLRNRTLASMVIKDLGLEKKYAFEVASSALWPHFRSKFTDGQRTVQKSLIPTDKKEMRLFRAKMLDWYQRHLTVTPIRDSNLVNVSFSGRNGELITRIVNRHAQAAITNTIHRHQSQAKDALDWLKAQIETQKKEVQFSERAIYEFKKKHNVLSLEDSQVISSLEIQQLSNALTSAKSERITRQATYRQLMNRVKNKKDVMSLPEISNYSVIENLKNQLVGLNSREIEMRTKFGPKHPKMRELRGGINQIKSEILTESNRLKRTIKAELDRAETIEAAITKALDEQKRIAMSIGERTIEYEVLKQQAESSRDIYDFLLKQSEELGLASAISRSNMRIVDKAEVPVDPVRPKIKLNILVSIFLALFTSMGMVFLLEYLDNTVKTPKEIVYRLGLPVLGMIPFNRALQKKDTHLSLLKNDHNTYHQEIIKKPLSRTLNRLPAEFRITTEGLFGRLLAVGSVSTGEGKSTVVAQLSANLTEAGLRVLLVDCDFERPTPAKKLQASKGGGLAQSIDRIKSQQLSSGTLNDYSVDDLFFLMALKKKSGHLLVENENQTFIAHFQNGVLIHIHNKNSPENNRIGTMLLNAGFITEGQLNDALHRHQRTGQPLGYILVNAGYIGRDKLRGPLRLQFEEYIQKLFTWKVGRFSFKPELINIYENEKIFFEEDYGPLINNLGRVESSKFIEKELFSNITGLEKENLYLLPSGTPHKFIGSLNQVLMKKIFEKLKQHFDVVLIDTPPLAATSGMDSLFPLTDGIILVIKAGHLSVKNLNGAIYHLPQDKILGTVLNQVKFDHQHNCY